MRREAGLELGLLALLQILAYLRTQQSSPFFLKVLLLVSPVLSPSGRADHYLHSTLKSLTVAGSYLSTCTSLPVEIISSLKRRPYLNCCWFFFFKLTFSSVLALNM